MNIYTILGATGHTGKPIVLGLLNKGHKVRIISRSKEKAKELIDKGADLFEGDSTDESLLKRAFEGANAVYAMVPFNAVAEDYTAFQMSHINAISNALKESTIKFVVTLSSAGAHLKEGSGVVNGLYHFEQKLNANKRLNTMHLRAAYFMENTLGQVGAIKGMDAMGSPVKGDLKMPMVATNDISEMALHFLLSLDFSGSNYEYVLGSRDVSYNEVANVFGKAIGKPDLKYFTISYEDGAKAMMQMGMGESVTTKMMEFVRALNEGRVLEDTVRNTKNTTSTSIEDFAQVFKAVYEG